MFWLNILAFVATNTTGNFPTVCQFIRFFVALNTAGNYPEVSLKLSSDLTLTNVKTQSQTVVTGFTAFSALTQTRSPPLPDLTVYNWM